LAFFHIFDIIPTKGDFMKKDKIKIIYEDKYIIVVEKPAKLLTIATNNELEKTMFHKVINYEKQKNKNNKIFIVHRLDKDTSGLLIFAKDEKTKKILQDNWDKTIRKYIAVVEGKVERKKDIIKNCLTEDKYFMTHVTDEKNGKIAITEYQRIKVSKSYSLLDINIKTGRKNQIRVHMKEIGHPIIGDKKYKSKTNPLNRLGLHAYYLELKHPITKEIMKFESKIPCDFLSMFPQQ
jgi:RluA family pseudouridine synthase